MPTMFNQSKTKAVQQNFILQQMHIDVWVNHDTQTTNIDKLIEQAREHSTSTKVSKVRSTSTIDVSKKSASNNTSLDDEPITYKTSKNFSELENKNVGNTLGSSLNTQKVETKQTDSVHAGLDITEKAATDIKEERQIHSLSLQGFYHNNWVIIADMAFLTVDEQKVWDSLCRALKVSVESFNFPNSYLLNGSANQSTLKNSQTYSVEMAKINFSGFINRLSQFKQDVHIACLTKLTDGLADKRIKSVPTLTQMLTDVDKKREFWQLLTDETNT